MYAYISGITAVSVGVYFISTDAHLLKKTIIGVEVVDPIEFIRREVKK